MIKAEARSRLFLSLAGMAAGAMLATVGVLSAATPAAPLVALPQAQRMFADAPDGVDPIVTGPVSAAFRQRQAAAGCDTAEWPDIPAACYPD